MIAKLRGIVDGLGEDYAVIDVGGVGYLVFASNRTLSKLTRGTEVSLWIETVVSEDSISLYGFFHPLEKEWFLTLTKVQGVGAKVCLSILSVLSPSQLAQAVAAQDKGSFARANGVGPKLAARIASELKGKTVGLPQAADTGELAAAMAPDEAGTPAAVSDGETPSKAVEDAISALVNLGYQRIEAYRAVNLAAAGRPEADVGLLIKLALKEFANKEV